MADRTRLDEDAARRLLDAYGLTFEALTALPDRGTVNSNFRVRAGGRDYFLRVNEGKRDEDAIAEAHLVARLRARGVPTPEIVATGAGEPIARHLKKPVTLFAWVDGEEAQPPRDARRVGRALGELHTAGEALSDPWPRDHYALPELRRRLARFAADVRVTSVAPGLVEALTEELDRGERLRGRRGLIHQDLFPDNVLVDGGRLWLLDFEQATEGRLLYDLAVALNAWCWEGDAIVARDLVSGYREARALSTEEEGTLVDEARLAAARFTITRVTDVFLDAAATDDLKRRKDFRDYARRLAWWRARA
jgi:homoserine kinase type II